MTKTFSANIEEGYFISKFTGEISDGDLLSSYKAYFEKEGWTPLSKEIVDLSELDSTTVTSDGMRRLSSYIENLLIERGITTYHTTVYAPHDLTFGLSRIYEVMAGGSPESVMVFRQLSDAVSWIKERRISRRCSFPLAPK